VATRARVRAVREALEAALAGAGVGGPAAGGTPAAGAGAGPDAGGVAGVGHASAGGMAALRGQMATFDALFAGYAAYVDLPDDAARTAFRQCYGSARVSNRTLARLLLPTQVTSRCWPSCLR